MRRATPLLLVLALLLYAIPGGAVSTKTRWGPIFIKEQAADKDSVAGYGQLWVKDPGAGNPNELWFTSEDNTSIEVGTGGGGSSIILDLGDDDVNESTALIELATVGDTNTIFTEPTANKLLITVSNNWPTADLADVASTGDTATAFFSAGTIEHEYGGLEENVYDYNGLIRIAAGATSNVTNLAELNTAIGSGLVTGAHTADTTCSDSACTLSTDDTITLEGGTTITGIENDEMLMGTGSGTAAFIAMPTTGGGSSCHGAGEALQYNTSTNTWACLTGLGAGGTVDDITADDLDTTTGANITIAGGSGITTSVAADTVTITGHVKYTDGDAVAATASTYLALAGGVLTGEATVDDLGLAFTEGDTLTDCLTFPAGGGGIFYDASEGKFKKCQNTTLSDLDTGSSLWVDLAPNLEPADDGDGIRLNDSVGTDYCVAKHDGTDLDIACTNTTQIDIDTPVAATSFIADASASPGITLLDSDAPGADKDVGGFLAGYIDGADGAENSDVWIEIMQAGLRTPVLTYDESQDRWEIPTGKGFAVGTTQWDVAGASDAIDGEVIGDDTIDDDSIDWTDVTFADFTAQNWRVFYSNGSGVMVELALGADGTYLKSNGASAIPTFDTPAGAGDVALVGDCISGDCLDGTSDGGSFVRIYDGNSNYGEFQVPDISADITYTFPAATSTILATDGVGTSLTALDGENIQDDTIDDDSIDFGTGTAVDYDDITTGTITGAIDMLTTGTIRGQVHIVTTSITTDSPSADEMRGSMHIATNASGCDYTLPTAVAGMSACFYDYNGGGVVTLDAAAGDEIILNGTGVGVADAIDSAGDVGDFICLLAIDATDWITLGRSGTWVDGGVD
jgi:hypothetical protein